MGRFLVLVISLLASVQIAWADKIVFGDLAIHSFNFSVAQAGQGICDYAYAPGTEITLTATPCPDSNFIKWTGDFCHGSKVKTCTFVMPNKAVNINAEFRKKPMKPVWRKNM